jgi:hypothetical protein
MPAAVQDATVGTAPRSAPNSRTAFKAESLLAINLDMSPRGRPPNTKVFELCIAGSTNCPLCIMLIRITQIGTTQVCSIISPDRGHDGTPLRVVGESAGAGWTNYSWPGGELEADDSGIVLQGQDFGSWVSGTPSAKYKAYGGVTGPPLSWTVKSTHATSSETITVS